MGVLREIKGASKLRPFGTDRPGRAVRGQPCVTTGRVGAVWRANRGAVLAAAVMFVTSYLLVLFVIRISPVSYVSSVREMSVVFAAVLGAFMLHEPLGEKKILGAVLIFAGILCIGLAQ